MTSSSLSSSSSVYTTYIVCVYTYIVVLALMSSSVHTRNVVLVAVVLLCALKPNVVLVLVLVLVVVEISRNYPERNARILVVNAPPSFNAAWRLVKPILPANTRLKVYGTHTATVAPRAPLRGVSDDRLCDEKGVVSSPLSLVLRVATSPPLSAERDGPPAPRASRLGRWTCAAG
jgi:hypothetical protein